MTSIRSKALAALAAATLASGALAQTSTSPGASPSQGTTTSPGSSGPRQPGAAPGGPPMLPPSVTSPSGPLGPSTTSPGATFGRGINDPLATPEDRAKCAGLSSSAQADCIADARKQRELDEQIRSSRETRTPGPQSRM